MQEIKEIETKLEVLEVKGTRNIIKNKRSKKEDRIEDYRIIIGAVIRAMNKLNEMNKIKTKIDELEKEKCLVCISMTERLYGY